MATDKTPRPFKVFCPGATIKEEIEEHGISQAVLANLLGMSEKSVSLILSGKQALTPETALKLEKILGPSAQFWMNLESRYQIRRQENSEPVKATELKTRLNSIFPLGYFIKHNWLDKGSSAIDWQAEAFKILGINSFDEFENKKVSFVNFRKTNTPTSNLDYCLSWVLTARTIASNSPTRVPYNDQKLRQLADNLHTYTLFPENNIPRFLDKLEHEAGVRFVYLEPFEKTRIDGASFWLSKDEPAIAYSGRIGNIGHFWFTLAHEIAHLLLHHSSPNQYFVDEFNAEDPNTASVEIEANQQATIWLKTINPEKHLPPSVKLPSLANLAAIASNLGIHPGVYIGALQFTGRISYKVGRAHLVPVKEIIPSKYKLNPI